MQPKYSSPSNQDQRESSTYRLAETDRDFITRQLDARRQLGHALGKRLR
jgi:hypothetical protein